MFCSDPEFCFKNEYIRSFLEQKQENESFRSWKNVGLTLLLWVTWVSLHPQLQNIGIKGMVSRLPLTRQKLAQACWASGLLGSASTPNCGMYVGNIRLSIFLWLLAVLEIQWIQIRTRPFGESRFSPGFLSVLWIRIQWGPWSRFGNPYPGGQKCPTKKKNFIFWSAGCSLLRV